MTAKLYRREKSAGHKSWHFCKTCHRWPSGGDFEETRYEPWTDICSRCRQLEKEHRCTSGIRWL